MSPTAKVTVPIAAACAALAFGSPAGAKPIQEPYQGGPAPTAIAKYKDLRSADAKDAARRATHPVLPKRLPGPQMWVERSDPAYGKPGPAPVEQNDGTPWATIAIGVGGAGLLIGSGAAIAGRGRLRTRRARVAT